MPTKTKRSHGTMFLSRQQAVNRLETMPVGSEFELLRSGFYIRVWKAGPFAIFSEFHRRNGTVSFASREWPNGEDD